MLLSGKNIIITGARRGIGRAMAEVFARNGANLWACIRTPDRAFGDEMTRLSEKNGVWIKTVPFELTDGAARKAAVQGILKEKLPIHGLVNNAGEVRFDPFHLLPEAALRRMTENNYFAPLLFTQPIARAMGKTGGGSIVFLSSVSGLRAEAGSTAYGGGKAAIAHCAGVLARELAPEGIRVNAIAPGMVDTDMQRSADEAYWRQMVDRTFLKRMGTPEEIANTAMFLLSDLSGYITGQTIRVDGGMA